MVTVHKETRYKSNIAILDNAHWKVQTLFYFMLKSDWPNWDKITSKGDNAISFSAFCFSLFIPISSAETWFSQQNVRLPGFLMQCHILLPQQHGTEDPLVNSPWRSKTSVSRKGSSVTSACSEWNVLITFWIDFSTVSSSLSVLCNTDTLILTCFTS